MFASTEPLKMQLDKGFTLLEILAALAIAVIGIMAVAKTTHSAVGLLQSTEDRVLATWVASNRLAELRIARAWPSPVGRDLVQEQGGRTWYTREEVSATVDPDLLRIDLTVYRDEDYQHLSATLFGYLARYSPPSAPAAEPGLPDEEPGQGNADEAEAVEGAEDPGPEQEETSSAEGAAQ